MSEEYSGKVFIAKNLHIFQAINHAPFCQCLPDFTGNPFAGCIKQVKLGLLTKCIRTSSRKNGIVKHLNQVTKFELK